MTVTGTNIYYPPVGLPQVLPAGAEVPASLTTAVWALAQQLDLETHDLSDIGGVVFRSPVGGGGGVQYWRVEPSTESFREVEETPGLGLNGGDWSWVSPAAYYSAPTGGSPAASGVSFTPYGDIAATDVQAALEELDDEKASLAHTHDTIPQDLNLPGDISPTTFSGQQNDYNPASLSTASVLRLSLSAAASITGIQGGADGRILVLLNTTAYDLSISHQDTNSTAANRIITPNGERITMKEGASLILIYDSTTSRWRVAAQAQGHVYDQRIIEREAGNQVVNTLAETSLSSATIPANTLGTNKGVRLTIAGTITNNSGSNRTLTVRVKYGTTTIWDDVSPNLAASATVRAFRFELELFGDGATGAQVLTGKMMVGQVDAASSGTGGFVAGSIPLAPIFGTAAEDSTADKTLEVTVQWSAADANLDIYQKYAVYERI